MGKKINLTEFINSEVKKIVLESLENGESYNDMIDRLDDMSEMIDETEKTCMECGGELKEGICESCNGGVKESKKKILRLNETQLRNMVRKIISEKEFKIPSVTSDTLKQNEKINNDNIKNVDEKVAFLNKLKDDEVDDNRRENTEEEDEYVEDFRGGGMEDIDYDSEPDDKFLERMKLSLVGDHKMGNGAEEKDKTGEKMFKKIDRKKEKIEKQPMYQKEPTPVKIVKEDVEKEILKVKKLFKHKF